MFNLFKKINFAKTKKNNDIIVLVVGVAGSGKSHFIYSLIKMFNQAPNMSERYSFPLSENLSVDSEANPTNNLSSKEVFKSEEITPQKTDLNKSELVKQYTSRVYVDKITDELFISGKTNSTQEIELVTYSPFGHNFSIKIINFPGEVFSRSNNNQFDSIKKNSIFQYLSELCMLSKKDNIFTFLLTNPNDTKSNDFDDDSFLALRSNTDLVDYFKTHKNVYRVCTFFDCNELIDPILDKINAEENPVDFIDSLTLKSTEALSICSDFKIKTKNMYSVSYFKYHEDTKYELTNTLGCGIVCKNDNHTQLLKFSDTSQLLEEKKQNGQSLIGLMEMIGIKLVAKIVLKDKGDFSKHFIFSKKALAKVSRFKNTMELLNLKP